mmetsp:Transcript_376/g.651  ORF Transcript_376/g.651 Transcript_376/m.651 type:complete len:218 (-) Transcript_376:621-1274(-)
MNSLSDLLVVYHLAPQAILLLAVVVCLDLHPVALGIRLVVADFHLTVAFRSKEAVHLVASRLAAQIRSLQAVVLEVISLLVSYLRDLIRLFEQMINGTRLDPPIVEAVYLDTLQARASAAVIFGEVKSVEVWPLAAEHRVSSEGAIVVLGRLVLVIRDLALVAASTRIQEVLLSPQCLASISLLDRDHFARRRLYGMDLLRRTTQLLRSTVDRVQVL